MSTVQEKNAPDNVNETKFKEAESLSSKAMNFYKMGKYSEAYEYFSKSKTAYEQSGDTTQQFIQQRYMGILKENMGEIESALKLYTESKNGLEKAGDFEEMSETAYRLGTCFYRENKKDEAIAEFQQAANKGAKNPNIYNNMGFLKIEKNDLAGAEKDFTKACELSTKEEDESTLNLALNNLGVVSYLSSNYEKAMDYLTQAEEKAQNQPKSERTIQYIVFCNEKHKELTDKKFDIFDEVITLAGIMLNKAASSVMLGKNEEALGFVKKAIEIDGGMAYLQIPSAWIYLSAGENDKAINTFKNAMLSNPEHKEYIEKIVTKLNPYAFMKIERNEECPCGSGKKFKKCHGK